MQNRESKAQKARRELLDRERRTAAAVVREYGQLIKRLTAEIERVAADIESATRRGEMSSAAIIEKLRLKRLFDAVSDEIEISARVLGLIGTASQTAAITTAKNQISETVELNAETPFAFDDEATRQLAGSMATGEPLGDYFARLDKPVRSAMFSILTFGVAAGKPSPQIASELKTAVAMNSARALTIVRTETNRVYRESSRVFYESAGITRWRWVAALDLNTCPICWSQHGRIFKVKTIFGTHPNCRCTMVAVLPGDAATATGAEMFARLTAAQQKTILGAARFDLYNDGATLADFVGTQQTPFGLSRTLKNIKSVEYQPTGKPPGAPKPKSSAKPKTSMSSKPAAPVQDFNFKTTADAERWAAEKYPNIIFDFSKAKPATINPTLKEFDRLATEFPEVAARLKYIGTYKTKPVPYYEHLTIDPLDKNDRRRHWLKWRGAVAHASTDGRRIGLNPSYYGNEKKMTDTLERCFAENWLATGTIPGTFAHEFGHQIDNWFSSLSMKSFSEYVRADGGGIFGNAFAAWKKKFIPTADLSRYAISLPVERMSEGFASLQHNEPAKQDAYTVALGKFIKGFRQLRLYDPPELGKPPTAGQYKDSRDAPPGESRTQVLDEIKKSLKLLGLDYDKDF